MTASAGSAQGSRGQPSLWLIIIPLLAARQPAPCTGAGEQIAASLERVGGAYPCNIALPPCFNAAETYPLMDRDHGTIYGCG